MSCNRFREYDVIAGPFAGTYGEVWIGRHTTLGSKKAFKRLYPWVRPDVIREEALKQQTVRSPYVVQIHDFYEAADGQTETIVMEYCPIGLDQFLRQRFKQTDGTIPCDEARQLLDHVLLGLNDAHIAGVVHGDLKPANVRFGEGRAEGELGLPKISDFGAAHRVRETFPALRGSTNWMAPELLEGGDATRESDYFSFGVLAYLVFGARHPFFSTDPTCLTAEEDNVRDPTFSPLPLSSLRPDIATRVTDLVMELLSRDKDARKNAWKALQAALASPREIEAEAVIAAPGTGAPPPPDVLRHVEEAYSRAREQFFMLYQPREAVETLGNLLADVGWEAFKGTGLSRIADCWSLRAYINNSGGLFEDAVEAGTNGLSVDGEHVNSLHARGYAYLQLGRNADAETDLRTALELTQQPRKREQIRKLLDTIRAR